MFLGERVLIILEMEIMHATQSEGLLKILKQGLLLPSQDIHRGETTHSDFSDPKSIYLSLVEGKSYGRLKEDLSASFWGHFYLFLNLDWVKENPEQFRIRGYDFTPEDLRFLQQQGIMNDPYLGNEPTMPRQLVSLKSIPLEGLRGLVLRGDPNSLSKPWEVFEKDLDLVRGHKIHKDDYGSSFIDLGEFIPKGMELYVGDENWTVRIK